MLSVCALSVMIFPAPLFAVVDLEEIFKYDFNLLEIGECIIGDGCRPVT